MHVYYYNILIFARSHDRGLLCFVRKYSNMKTLSCALLGGRKSRCDEDNTMLITAGCDLINVDVFIL